MNEFLDIDFEQVVIGNNIFGVEKNSRDSSFDYCYNFFRNNENILIDKEKSCLVIGFYLASWGMFRGSSFLLEKSIFHFDKLIDYISKQDRKLWEIDVNNYTTENIVELRRIYDDIREIIIPNKRLIKNRVVLKKDITHLTLVTKIMLGVFGNTPAYDYFFCKTFKEIFKNKCTFNKFDEESLKCIHDFYCNNIAVINKLSNSIRTNQFHNDEKSNIFYPKAKIIDMYGFSFSYNGYLKKKIKNEIIQNQLF